MSRAVLRHADQIAFFKQITQHSNLHTDALGKFVGISGRSYRDWQSGKTLPKYESITFLGQQFNVALPKILELREEYWSGRIYGSKAAIIQNLRYGPPGTPAGRSKGGRISQQRRRENPEYYRSLGCIVPNHFVIPPKSPQLAEFVGIILGDGGITTNQLSITLNSHADRSYIPYVISLIKSLFQYQASSFQKKNAQAVVIYITGVEFIKYLQSIGLFTGNKVKQQVSVPTWITVNKSYVKACLRGLMDTDGGIFHHQYTINHKRYSYPNLQFTNRSLPLINFVYHTLLANHFHPCHTQKGRVWLYRQSDIYRYIYTIGSSNNRLLDVFKCYNARSLHRMETWHSWSTAGGC